MRVGEGFVAAGHCALGLLLLCLAPFAVAVGFGGHHRDPGVGGGLQQEAERLLARARGQWRIGARARGLVHDRDGQLVDRRGRAVGEHPRTVEVKV